MVSMNTAQRNKLIGGEPGSGKSVALQLVAADGALSVDVQPIFIDGNGSNSGFQSPMLSTTG